MVFFVEKNIMIFWKKAKKELAAMESKKEIIAEVVEDIAGTDDKKKVIIAEVVETPAKPVITE